MLVDMRFIPIRVRVEVGPVLVLARTRHFDMEGISMEEMKLEMSSWWLLIVDYKTVLWSFDWDAGSCETSS